MCARKGIGMDTIVLLIRSPELRQGLADRLGQRYKVMVARGKRPLQETFDLAILDEATLKRLHKAIQERRTAEPTRFLPFLLVTTSDAPDGTAAHLGQTIDEWLAWPTDEVALHTRVQHLLRTRHVTCDLEAARQQVQQLSLSEERHRALAALVSGYAYAHRLEADGTIIREWVTPEGYRRVTGYDERDLPTLDDPSARGRLIHPQDLPIWQRRIENIRAGQPDASEFRIVTKGGEVRWVRAVGRPEFDAAQQRVTRFIGATQDITERKHAEEELKVQQAYLDQLFENAPEGIVLLDTDDRVLRVNGEFTRMFGYTPADAINRPINELVVPDDRRDEGWELTYKLTHGQGVHTETVRRHKDGRRLHVSIVGAPVRIGSGQIAVYAIYRDITERKTAEEALHQSQQQYHDLVESTHDLIQSVAPDGRFLFVNQAWLQTLGYTQAQLPSLRIADIVHPRSLSHWNGVRARVLAEETGQYLQATLVARDGRSILVEGTLIGRHDDGNLVALHGFFRDITERVRLQEQLIERERLAALGRITGAIAHELGTPLNSVLGYTQLLANAGISEEARRRLKIIESQVQRMTEIIKHYLSRTRGAPHTYRPVNLNELVLETLVQLEIRCQQRHVHVMTELSESLPVLNADGTALQRVLINLLNNALDAMEAGGTITVTTGMTEPPESPRRGIVVKITDTGAGIPAELLPKVFNLFVTTKSEARGTGLGLAISQEIIRAHGGSIDISSQVGEGTCVRIVLPTEEPSP
jgi:two-component system, sporulation sensor kinase A